MKEDYFTIYFGEDGMYLEKVTKAQVLEKINRFEATSQDFVAEISSPISLDYNSYPLGKTLVIKGEIAVPKPIEIVKRFEL